MFGKAVVIERNDSIFAPNMDVWLEGEIREDGRKYHNVGWVRIRPELADVSPTLRTPCARSTLGFGIRCQCLFALQNGDRVERPLAVSRHRTR